MEDLLNYIPAFLIWSPVLLSIVFYQLYCRIKGNKWGAVHFTVQISVLFYLAATAVLVYKLFQLNIIGYIFIALISLLAIILIIQWKRDTEVLLLKGIKLLLRVSFLIAGLGYLVLIIMYIIRLAQ